MIKLSRITNDLIGQPMFNLLAKADELEKRGKKIIHLEIGDPNFNSPRNAIDTTIKSLNNNLTHYTNSMGIREFREEICNYTEKYFNFRPELQQVLECPANAIIDFVIRCVADIGDEIIYPDPGFSTYYSAIKYNGMIPVNIQLKEENCFRMQPDDIYNKITNKTKLIIINTPNNPTGAVMTQAEVDTIAKIAYDNDIYLLSDEVYSRIIYNKKHYSPSAFDKCKNNTIILNSLSKMFSMSGWRLGYAIGPENLIEKMGLLLQTIMSCQPAFTQYGGVEILKNNEFIVNNIVSELMLRRDILIKYINSINRLHCIIPDGAFYAFINISKTGIDSHEYSKMLLDETGVCVLPGSCFGAYGEKYIRICYASVSSDIIKIAMDKIKKFTDNL